MNSPIFLDSQCFIYLFEQNPEFHDTIKPIFSKVSKGLLKAKTSIITVSEVLTKPFQTGDNEVVNLYLEAFSKMPNLEVLTPDYKLAISAAKVRAKYNLNLPDSYQITMAIENKCKTFLTNNGELKKIKEIKVSTLEDLT